MLMIQADVRDSHLPGRARQGGLEIADHQVRWFRRQAHAQSGQQFGQAQQVLNRPRQRMPQAHVSGGAIAET